MHFMPEDHEKFMDVNKQLVKPGGLFIMEGYTIDQIALSSAKKARDDGVRCRTSQNICRFRYSIASGNKALALEGPRHQGDAATIQIIARKPA